MLIHCVGSGFLIHVQCSPIHFFIKLKQKILRCITLSLIKSVVVFDVCRKMSLKLDAVAYYPVLFRHFLSLNYNFVMPDRSLFSLSQHFIPSTMQCIRDGFDLA